MVFVTVEVDDVETVPDDTDNETVSEFEILVPKVPKNLAELLLRYVTPAVNVKLQSWFISS